MDDVVAFIPQPYDSIRPSARELHERLTKPSGSLGRLETIGVQLSAISGEVPPPLPRPAVIVVFAGDHGVVVEGISEWPQEVTGQMLTTMSSGGAAINAIATSVGAELVLVDVGVNGDVSHLDGVEHRKIASGTRNIRRSAAMSLKQTEDAIAVGAEAAVRKVTEGARCLITGEMGIGNTTPAISLVCAITGADPWAATGRRPGMSEELLATKRLVIADAIDRCGRPDDPVELLAEIGGLEIAALTGFCLGAARMRTPVIVDGVVALAAALLAVELSPPARGVLIAGHCAAQPAAAIALEHLRLEPLLDLQIGIGEGVGAALAVPLVVAAAALMRDMATFADGVVSDSAAVRHA